MTVPDNTVTMTASVIATIPQEQWRGFLTDKVVRDVVEIYLRDHYAGREFDISTSGEGILVRLTAGPSLADLHVCITGGVVEAPQARDTDTVPSNETRRQQQRLVEELDEVLTFIADQHVERLVQFAIDEWTEADDAEDREDIARPRIQIEYAGKTHHVWAYAARPWLDGPIVTVAVLPHRAVYIQAQGHDISASQIHNAIRQAIDHLRAEGLAVELTSQIELEALQSVANQSEHT
ncbi:MAG TPA: hypothetical protein VF510_19870 [Ktedonobacterales bacterium]